MSKLQTWLIIILSCLLFWASLGKAVFAQEVSIRTMLTDKRYMPPVCKNDICVLTGLGGIVQVWEAHIDRNAGKTFIVKTNEVCASACFEALKYAQSKGENVIVEKGAKLIYHAPQGFVFK